MSLLIAQVINSSIRENGKFTVANPEQNILPIGQKTPSSGFDNSFGGIPILPDPNLPKRDKEILIKDNKLINFIISQHMPDNTTSVNIMYIDTVDMFIFWISLTTVSKWNYVVSVNAHV